MKKFFSQDGMFIVSKNVALTDLKKLPNISKNTKRHRNQNNNKIINFPREGAFEVRFMNIVIYSKLKS